MPAITEIFGDDAHAMTKELLAVSNAAAELPRSANIALKPNLVTDSTPDMGATTHAGVLAGCLEYFREKGFTNLSVIEGSWVGARTEDAFRLCGYDRVCREYNVPFYDLKKDRTVTVPTPLRNMEICARAVEADLLVDLPVLKGHCQTVMTCAVKNLKGCLPDQEKRRFHREGLMRPIAALASAMKPGLCIVDSICGDLNFEEGGNPVRTDRMYLTADAVLADAYGCRLMGLSVRDVGYLPLAEEWGAGRSAFSEDDILRLNRPEAAPDYSGNTGLIRKLSAKVAADSACSACYAALIRALYQLSENGLRLSEPAAIGQGFRGKTQGEIPARIGIGTCTAGAERCIHGCPPDAGAIRAFLEEIEVTRRQ